MAAVVYFLLALVAAASAAPGSRIVGGTPVTIQEFPYAVSFQYTYVQAGITVQRCVGSLISSWHVLTSGFCYTGAILENMELRAGSTYSLTGGTTVTIRTFEKHPDYLESPRAGDLVVTFLDTALPIGDYINVLFLPPASTNIADGTALKVVSWGFDAPMPDGNQLEFLKQVFFNKVNVDECIAKYEEHADSVTITDAVICGQAAGVGICNGDSGAPMVINNVIVGVSSYFESCDDEYPAVFTRVDRYTNWILEVTTSGARSGNRAGIMASPIVA